MRGISPMREMSDDFEFWDNMIDNRSSVSSSEWGLANSIQIDSKTMISASSRVMISAWSVGTRATYDEPYDSDGEETADTEWDEKGRNIISHIYISYRNFITSIQFGYLNSEDDEALTLSMKFGPSEGHSFRAVSFVFVENISFSLSKLIWS